MSNPLKKLMPAIYKHQGIWHGEYQTVDQNGTLIDQHQSRVECIFPESGKNVYIQRNRFTWPDKREIEMSFSGELQGNRLYWNTDAFHGYGWQASDHIFLLELQRKDVPGASFTEVIVLDQMEKTRARTWHWFKDGKCYQRTLCNEFLV